ncbi:YcaO-like family protein [Amycolatopsis suaedae]|uniref:Bacteriocin biosynthesis protein SagD n=1 Tax=Amycolatopsis suaedae TaxID=2510978 RepID=A0A4Q7JAB2_9PSEU|nr:YcaO-like family protein [Amycolatopsis suaedae]RZQ64721.1 bacteriocin biosynthesis protein SagD [Amycolatopsis suaedae]
MREDLLVDPRFGLVTELVTRPRQPGLPPAWVGCSAKVADTTRAGLSEVDRYGFGAALGDPAVARAAALGEAIERYCGNLVPDRLPLRSYRELRAAGVAAVDPAELALYSPRQYATPGFPFVPFTPDLEVAWTRGTDLRTGEEVWVPASLVYLNYFRGAHVAEPPTHALSYSGIATGPTPEAARQSALQELLERDASTLWWAGGGPADAVLDADAVTGQFADPAAPERTIRLFRIPSEFGAPVLAAFVTDHPGRDLIAFGTACRTTARAAAVKATVEAFAVLELTVELTEPDSELWRAVDGGSLGGHVFKPWRADRAYRQDFADDLRDLVDLPAVAQLYLDPAMRGEPLDRLRATEPAVPFAAIPDAPPLVEALTRAGLRAVAVDLTTPDVRAAGLHVTRVVVPGLYGNAPAAFPYLGGSRLPVAEDDVFPYPIPLA